MQEPKSVKVNCSFCDKEIECPEDMLEEAEKHMCFECFQNKDEKENIDFSKIHVDMPMDEFDEIMPEALTNSMVEREFPEIWHERKAELKEMSKKELAEEMFGAGAYIAITSLIQTLKEEAEREEKAEKDERKNED